jgi:hypothetical protein
MRPLEKYLEQLLVNFPNLVSSYLWGRRFPLVHEFGDINVCVRQGKLPECNGQVDLAFVTGSTVHVIELKRGTVGIDTVSQLKRYIGPVQERYPNHLTIGYLAGRKCKDWPMLRELLKNERVRVLLVGKEIPRIKELLTCGSCGAGFHYRHQICPYCSEDH